MQMISNFMSRLVISCIIVGVSNATFNCRFVLIMRTVFSSNSILLPEQVRYRLWAMPSFCCFAIEF